MSIVKSLEALRVVNWTDARPWIAMLGAVILFLGWEFRKKQREIQKLDLEIAQMRSQQCLVRVATIHEMNSLIKDIEEISARNLEILGGPSPLGHGRRHIDFQIRLNLDPFMIHETFLYLTETAFFHGGNTGSNPVGDAKSFQELTGNGHFWRRHKKAQLRRQFLAWFA